MELLSKEVLSLESFNKLGTIIKKQYELKNSKNAKITLNEFSLIFKLATEEIINTLTKENLASCNQCRIKKMPLQKRGSCTVSSKFITITINEDVVTKLYKGNILEILTLFHELNHGLIKYEIAKGTINYDLNRCLKEILITSIENKELVRIKNNLKNNFFTEGFYHYYSDNYSVYSEEKVADIMAINEFLTFINHFNIKITDSEQKELQKILKQNQQEYKNYLRDVRHIIVFNSYFIDFEEAFDIMIKEHPEWLKFKGLQTEYYLDEEGKVAKRSKEELLEMLSKEKQEYLKRLITEDRDKLLDKEAFKPTKTYDKFYYKVLDTKKYILKNNYNNKSLIKDKFINKHF